MMMRVIFQFRRKCSIYQNRYTYIRAYKVENIETCRHFFRLTPSSRMDATFRHSPTDVQMFWPKMVALFGFTNVLLVQLEVGECKCRGLKVGP